MSDKKKYRHYAAELKAAIVLKHLIEKVAVSKLCDEYQIKPSLFYKWQKDLADHAAEAFKTAQPSKEGRHDKETIKKLQDKLAQKNEVLAELMQEHIALKKECGEI